MEDLGKRGNEEDLGVEGRNHDQRTLYYQSVFKKKKKNKQK